MPLVDGLIEPTIVPETIVDGIGAIEQAGGLFRFVLYTRACIYDGGPHCSPSNVVVAKIIMSREAAAAMAAATICHVAETRHALILAH